MKPKLGLVAFEGSTDNNIILGPTPRRSSVNFTAMLDDRPGVPAAERYKAVGAGSGREEGLIVGPWSRWHLNDRAGRRALLAARRRIRCGFRAAVAAWRAARAAIDAREAA